MTSSELPVYAVYSRTGPRKILMLLKPRSKEVTYTPLGVQFLNLNPYNLPPYELTTNFLAINDHQFILLPYLKGRTVEQLITIQPTQPEYEIIDITPGEIYTGGYGQISPVSRSLESVTTCQDKHDIILPWNSALSRVYSICQHFSY